MGWVIGSNNCIGPRRFPYGLTPLSLMARGGVASTSGRSQQSGMQNIRAKHLKSKLPIGALSEKEFWARFHTLDTIPIQLTDDETLSDADLSNNLVYFTKEQFATRLRLPIPFLFKQFLHFTQIPPTFFIQLLFEYWWDVTCWTCSFSWTFSC